MLPRLAFFSPFNPQRSGVSDYSEELLPHLAEKAEVDLVAGPYELSNRAVTSRFRVISGEEFRKEAGRYDMTVYQVANSYYQHAYMIPFMRSHPGVVVLHDYYLHYLILGLTVLGGDFPALLDILRPVYGPRARSIGWRLLLSLADPYRISLTAPLIDMARAVVTHSACARDLVVKDRPSKLVRVIPMAMPEIRTETRDQLRIKHGVSSREFVVASVSTLSYTKRIDVVLRAAASLHRRYPGFKLWILGGGKLGDQSRKTIAEKGLADCVRITGWTPPETYEEMLVAADAVVDLRFPSGAETSASLLRAIAAGKPAIVSDQGTFRELPDSFTRKIEVGKGEEQRLETALAELIDDRGLRARMSECAFGYARGEMRLDQAADAYISLIEEVRRRPEPVQSPELRSHTGRGQRMLWSTVYRAFRVPYLVRNYGWAIAMQRIAGEARGQAPA